MFQVIYPKNIIAATEVQLKQLVSKITTFYNEISNDQHLLEIPRLRTYILYHQE